MHKPVPGKPTESDKFPIPEEIYPVIDNDLARDNIENDIPAADLEDLLLHTELMTYGREEFQS